MVKFSSQIFRVSMMTVNNKGERNDRGKCLGWPVTSYGPADLILLILCCTLLFDFGDL